jgi:UDP-perosamine 4-acetyltransferase
MRVAMKNAILMPRVNVNDDSGLLVRWMKTPGDAVRCGELIAQVETTKAAVDIESDAEGFFHPLADPGDMIPVGAAIAWIVDIYDRDELFRDSSNLRRSAKQLSGNDRLISCKAQQAMDAAGVSASDIPGEGPISERDVRNFLGSRVPKGDNSADLMDELVVAKNSVILFGAADQGLVVLDCLHTAASFVPICFIDEMPTGATVGGLPVFTPHALDGLIQRGVRFAHICIGAPEPKLRIASSLKSMKLTMISAVHPRAIVAASATIGEGVYIGPGAVIGPEAVIGDYCQVNNNATIPHHVRLGVGVRVSDGANLAGGIVVGDRSYLGLGITVNTGCHIGADVTIVSGVSVFDLVPDGAVVRGQTIRR